MYDFIIIGGGPAGISAGIYAGRKKLKTLLITQDWGGQANLASEIDNYPGIESIVGIELMTKMKKHLKKQEIEIKEGKGVVAIHELFDKNSPFPKGSTPQGGGIYSEKSSAPTCVGAPPLEKEELIRPAMPLVEIETNNGEKYQGKALIITSGSHYKKMGLEREEEFVGKGISYCATCDAPLYKNKDVAVIGGGNAGLMTALALTPYVSHIYILEAMPILTGNEAFQEKLKAMPHVSILTKTKVKEFKGDKFISGLTYENETGEINELSVKGIFIAVGMTPNSSFLKDVVELNNKGEIIIDCYNQTSVKNIFAAGDVSSVPYKQVVIAVGEGAKAALSAYQYIKTNY